MSNENLTWPDKLFGLAKESASLAVDRVRPVPKDESHQLAFILPPAGTAFPVAHLGIASAHGEPEPTPRIVISHEVAFEDQSASRELRLERPRWPSPCSTRALFTGRLLTTARRSSQSRKASVAIVPNQAG